MIFRAYIEPESTATRGAAWAESRQPRRSLAIASEVPLQPICTGRSRKYTIQTAGAAASLPGGSPGFYAASIVHESGKPGADARHRGRPRGKRCPRAPIRRTSTRSVAVFFRLPLRNWLLPGQPRCDRIKQVARSQPLLAQPRLFCIACDPRSSRIFNRFNLKQSLSV